MSCWVNGRGEREKRHRKKENLPTVKEARSFGERKKGPEWGEIQG